MSRTSTAADKEWACCMCGHVVRRVSRPFYCDECGTADEEVSMGNRLFAEAGALFGT